MKDTFMGADISRRGLRRAWQEDDMKAGGRVIGSIRFPFTIVMGLLMAGTGAAETNVTICLEKENVMDLVEVFSRDHAIASMMFSGIGVKTDWHGYYRCRVRRDKPIVIQMTTDTPESNRPGALAYTRFEGGRIQVFYDRVQRAAQFSRLPDVLAHVLVHEITHVIEGTDQHSDVGIMKTH